MPEQLRMVYDESCPALSTPIVPQGFCIHPLRRTEWPAYIALRHECGFDLWTDEKIADFYAAHAIRDGILVAQEDATGRLVASATAEHGELPGQSLPGTLGWVMTRHGYEGRGLGRAISMAATQALFDAGLSPVYLLTDDFRLAAVALYLKMGWRPWLFQEDMPTRWQRLCDTLGYPPDWLRAHAIWDV